MAPFAHDPPRPPRRSRARVRSVGAAAALALWAQAGCMGDPDIVAQGFDAGSDAGFDAGGMEPPPMDAAVDPCNLDALLKKAGIPPEGIIVAATCQLPVSWLRSDEQVDVGSQDLRDLLLNSGPIDAPSEPPSSLLCAGQFSGFWYYDNPFNPTTILLCPDLCDFVRGAVTSRIQDLGCDSGLPPGNPVGPFPFSRPPPRDAASADFDAGAE